MSSGNELVRSTDTGCPRESSLAFWKVTVDEHHHGPMELAKTEHTLMCLS